MVDKRVGKALVAAVHATKRHISIMEVALKASLQGLLPRDVDGPNGTDALIAIAVSLMSTARARPIVYRVFDRPPSVWSGAVTCALKIASPTTETHAQCAGKFWRFEVNRRRAVRRAREAPTSPSPVATDRGSDVLPPRALSPSVAPAGFDHQA